MNRLFVDTSGWYAFLTKEDAYESVQKLFLDKHTELLTSNAVFSELITLLIARDHESVALAFGEKLREGSICRIYRIVEEDEENAWIILKKRRGRRLSYTDATTVAFMNRIKLQKLVTLDHGFREFGFDILP